MLKKLFVTAAAAAALSVPLAEVAWADPPDVSGNNNPVGAGGVPQQIGNYVPPGDPITPGSVFKETAKVPSSNNPDAYGDLIDEQVAPVLGAEPFGPTPPGVGTKTFTPGCNNGRHLTLEGTAGGTSICS